jgi:hypothetical protein
MRGWARPTWILAAVVAVVVVLALVGAYFAGGGAGPGPTTSTGVQTTAQSGSIPVMLSYNFQVNGTGGTLFVVLKNYAASNMSVTAVSLDGTNFSGGYLALDHGCQNFVMGQECGITLSFGGQHSPPADGSAHSLVIGTIAGASTYSVVAGETYHAECTYSSSC